MEAHLFPEPGKAAAPAADPAEATANPDEQAKACAERLAQRQEEQPMLPKLLAALEDDTN